jgi:hypothetical protein
MRQFVVITLTYRDNVMESIPMELVDGSEVAKIAYTLSESGTAGLTMLKVPLTGTSFVILSKTQLDETIVKLDIFDEKEFNKRYGPKKKKDRVIPYVPPEDRT